MTQDESNLAQETEFLRLRAMRAKLSLRYSLLVLAIFAAFLIAAISFSDIFAGRLWQGSELTLIVALAFLLMLLPVFIAGLFLRRMDRDVEPLRARLAERRRS